MSSLTRVTVLGGGVLGGQIAWHSAFKGKTVVIYDIAPDALERCRTTHGTYGHIYRTELGADEEQIRAAHARLTYTTDLAAAVSEAQLVIEAVPEVPEIKTATYAQMAPLLPSGTVVATNTSTFLPSDFAAATGRPDKFCALHFAVGVWVQNFAEIMVHPGTSRETATAVTQFAIEIGMVPIPVLRERSGYVVNAWIVPLLNAAQTLVTNGIAAPEDVDRTFMVNGARYGPMGMFDMIGMRTAYDVLSYWGQVSGDVQMSANADYLKTRFLDNGLLGLQTAKGYYEYPDPAYQDADFLAVPDVSVVPDIVARIFSH
jgi:3-hydroxyacyl-CoA dehydrogenase